MRKILITGSSGLIGKAIIEELKANSKMEIYAASSKHCGSNSENIYYINNNEIENVLRCENIDTLLQLAFPRNVKEEEWVDGFRFVMHILSQARKYNIRKIINVSSQSVYGWKRENCAKENDPVYLNAPYTTGKICSELWVEELFKDFSYTNVRLSTIISPITDERIPNIFFNQIIKDNLINIKGGNQQFSFLNVKDAARGLKEIISSDNCLRPIYNLGTEEYATILEIADMAVQIAQKYGYYSEIKIEKAEIRLNNRISVSAMKEDFGWVAKYTLLETLEEIFIENYIK